MAISINWATKVVSVPQSYLTALGGGRYELDVDQFRLDLKDIEDSEEGMAQPDTHSRNAPVTLSGVTYAQTFEVINGYTVTFENTGTPYTVIPAGANHNLGDVTNFAGHMSLVIGNSAGLIVVSSGSGLSPTQDAALTAIKAKTDSLAFTVAGQVDANVTHENGTQIKGDGTSADKFRSVLVP